MKEIYQRIDLRCKRVDLLSLHPSSSPFAHHTQTSLHSLSTRRKFEQTLLAFTLLCLFLSSLLHFSSASATSTSSSPFDSTSTTFSSSNSLSSPATSASHTNSRLTEHPEIVSDVEIERMQREIHPSIIPRADHLIHPNLVKHLDENDLISDSSNGALTELESTTYTSVSAAAKLYASAGECNGLITSYTSDKACCGGLTCPYPGGVCCSSGQSCCPSGAVCLPPGPDGSQQCGMHQSAMSSPRRDSAQSGLGGAGGCPCASSGPVCQCDPRVSADVVKKEACRGKAACNPNDIMQMVEPEIREGNDINGMSKVATQKVIANSNPMPGSTPAPPTSADVQLDPNWKLIARSSGLRAMVHWKAGLNTPKDGDYIEPCTRYNYLGTGANVTIRLMMGEVIDYFRPTPRKSLCNMLLSANSHEWSASQYGPWQTPNYLISDYFVGGGSTDFWSRKATQGKDPRKYISFWGSLDNVGGCCANKYGVGASWGQPYQIYLYVKGPIDPIPVVNLTNTTASNATVPVVVAAPPPNATAPPTNMSAVNAAEEAQKKLLKTNEELAKSTEKTLAESQKAQDTVLARVQQNKELLHKLEALEKESEKSKNIAYVTQLKLEVQTIRTSLLSLQNDQQRLEKEAAEREKRFNQENEQKRKDDLMEKAKEQDAKNAAQQAAREAENKKRDAKDEADKKFMEKLIADQKSSEQTAKNATAAEEMAKQISLNVAKEKQSLELNVAAHVAAARAYTEKEMSDKIAAAEEAATKTTKMAIAKERDKTAELKQRLDKLVADHEAEIKKVDETNSKQQRKRLEDERQRATDQTKLAQQATVMAQQAAAEAQKAAGLAQRQMGDGALDQSVEALAEKAAMQALQVQKLQDKIKQLKSTVKSLQGKKSQESALKKAQFALDEAEKKLKKAEVKAVSSKSSADNKAQEEIEKQIKASEANAKKVEKQRQDKENKLALASKSALDEFAQKSDRQNDQSKQLNEAYNKASVNLKRVQKEEELAKKDAASDPAAANKAEQELKAAEVKDSKAQEAAAKAKATFDQMAAEGAERRLGVAKEMQQKADQRGVRDKAENKKKKLQEESLKSAAVSAGAAALKAAAEQTEKEYQDAKRREAAAKATAQTDASAAGAAAKAEQDLKDAKMRSTKAAEQARQAQEQADAQAKAEQDKKLLDAKENKAKTRENRKKAETEKRLTDERNEQKTKGDRASIEKERADKTALEQKIRAQQDLELSQGQAKAAREARRKSEEAKKRDEKLLFDKSASLARAQRDARVADLSRLAANEAREKAAKAKASADKDPSLQGPADEASLKAREAQEHSEKAVQKTRREQAKQKELAQKEDAAKKAHTKSDMDESTAKFSLHAARAKEKRAKRESEQAAKTADTANQLVQREQDEKAATRVREQAHKTASDARVKSVQSIQKRKKADDQQQQALKADMDAKAAKELAAALDARAQKDQTDTVAESAAKKARSEANARTAEAQRLQLTAESETKKADEAHIKAEKDRKLSEALELRTKREASAKQDEMGRKASAADAMAINSLGDKEKAAVLDSDDKEQGASTSPITAPIPLHADYVPYGGKFLSPHYSRLGRLCFLSGTLKPKALNGQFSKVIATLPLDCRPSQNQIFIAAAVGRVDVLRNGDVSYVAGNPQAPYLSLDSIAFPADGAVLMDVGLNDPWGAFGDGFGNASFTRQRAYTPAAPPTVCWGASSESWASFQVDGAGRQITGFLLEYVSGGTQCSLRERMSHWGCGGKLQVFITREGRDQNNQTQVVFPRGDETGLTIEPRDTSKYTMKGVAPDDEVLKIWLTFPIRTNRNGPSRFRISHGSDFKKKSNIDHKGTVCAKLNVLYADDLCLLSGVVRLPTLAQFNRTNSVIGTIPADCRPKDGRLVFNADSSDHPQRVDIHPDGRVEWIAGIKEFPWVSLAGVAYFTESSGSINLINDFIPFGEGFRVPSFKRQGKLCMLSGLIKGGSTQAVNIAAPLPAECRPRKTLTFITNYNDVQRRFDVFADGNIYSHGGDGFKSLDGIRFVVDDAAVEANIKARGAAAAEEAKMAAAAASKAASEKLAAAKEEADKKGAQGAEEAAKREKETREAQQKQENRRLKEKFQEEEKKVSDQQQARAEAKNKATLRAQQEQRNKEEEVARASQERMAEIEEADKEQPSSTDVALRNGFVSYGEPYSPPHFSLVGHLCVLSGTVNVVDLKAAITTLPPSCLPVAHHVFLLQVEGPVPMQTLVSDSGEVQYQAGPNSADWVSLDGVVFPIQEAPVQPIDLVGGWRNFEAGYVTASYYRRGDWCAVSGVLAIPTAPREFDKHVANIPSDCRPLDGDLVFILPAGDFKGAHIEQRIEITWKGEVHWRSPFNSQLTFLSLSGISFFAGTRTGKPPGGATASPTTGGAASSAPAVRFKSHNPHHHLHRFAQPQSSAKTPESPEEASADESSKHDEELEGVDQSDDRSEESPRSFDSPFGASEESEEGPSESETSSVPVAESETDEVEYGSTEYEANANPTLSASSHTESSELSSDSAEASDSQSSSDPAEASDSQSSSDPAEASDSQSSSDPAELMLLETQLSLHHPSSKRHSAHVHHRSHPHHHRARFQAYSKKAPAAKVVPEGLVTCEGQRAHLDCGPLRRISIISAVWGRQHSNICPHHNWWQNRNTHCSLGVSKEVGAICNHQSTCTVRATSQWGDPCEGTSKYLVIQHACVIPFVKTGGDRSSGGDDDDGAGGAKNTRPRASGTSSGPGYTLHKLSSFASFNFGEYLIHAQPGGEAYLVKPADAVFEPLFATFKLVPAVNGRPGFISFQHKKDQRVFLRHQGFILKAQMNDNSQQFRDDSTFKPVKGLADQGKSGYVSFQSSNFPDRFIRHQHYLLKVLPNDGSWAFQMDATFKQVPPAKLGGGGPKPPLPGVAPSQSGEAVIPKHALNVPLAWMSFNYPKWYISSAYNDAAQLVSKADGSRYRKAQATWRLVPALNNRKGHVSFMSIEVPNAYLRHKGFVLYLQRNDGTKDFIQSASFELTPGLADGGSKGFISFKSSNYPNRYIRQEGLTLKLQQNDNSWNFRMDASFTQTAVPSGTGSPGVPAPPPPPPPPPPAYDPTGGPAPVPPHVIKQTVLSWSGFVDPTHYIHALPNREAFMVGKDSTKFSPKLAAFRIVPGINNKPGFVSFLSAEYPDTYLRHVNWILHMQRFDGSVLFKDQSSFRVHAGLADRGKQGYVSFESASHPGRYIRQQRRLLKVHPSDGSWKFSMEASFRQTAIPEVNHPIPPSPPSPPVPPPLPNSVEELRATNNRSPIRLKSGFAASDRRFRTPVFHRQGAVCILSGTIQRTSQHALTVGRLPDFCRPITGRLVFHTDHYDKTQAKVPGDSNVARIDILPNGEIVVVSPNLRASKISLDGIVYVIDDTYAKLVFSEKQNGREKTLRLAAVADSKFLDLEPLYRPYGPPFSDPHVTALGSVCKISGRVSMPLKSNDLGRVPSVCKPRYRLVFNVLIGHGQTAQVDVKSDGLIVWQAGARGDSFSLDNMIYASNAAQHQPIGLQNGWLNYGLGYAPASYVVEGDVCIVSGRVRHSTWNTVIARLPNRCRPRDGRLTFNVNHGDSFFRLDVTAEGELIIGKGAKKYPWLSLDGVAFIVGSKFQPIRLLNGWSEFGQGFRKTGFLRQGSLCILTGMLAGKDGAFIAILPDDCRPTSGRLIFQVNHDDFTERVDIYPNGDMKWISGANPKPSGWVPLDGISFVVDKRYAQQQDARRQAQIDRAVGYVPTSQELDLLNGYTAFQDSYARPSCTTWGSVRFLSGMASSPGTGAIVTTLPDTCRPKSRSVYNILTEKNLTARFDVMPNGVVQWVSGEKGVSFASDSIAFGGEGAIDVPLILQSPWENFGDGFADASFIREGEVCVLSGLIKVPSSSLITSHPTILRLPAECRPRYGRLVFVLNEDQFAVRVDVMRSGRVKYISGPTQVDHISLGGIVYNTGRSTAAIALAGTYAPLKSGYRTPSYKVVGAICILSGVAVGEGEVIGNLPADCQPLAGSSIFAVISEDKVVRVRVSGSGRISLVGVPKDRRWVALDGIRLMRDKKFSSRVSTKYAGIHHAAVVAQPKTTPLVLMNDYRSFGSPFSDPVVTRLGDLCFCSGVAYAPNMKVQFAVLPANCRPKGALVFNRVISGTKTTRIDIGAAGGVYYVAGATGAWMPLDGVVFPVSEANVTSLALRPAWSNHGTPFAPAGYYVSGGMCYLTGVVLASDWSRVIAFIGNECRPKDARLVFNVNHHDFSHRVDITMDGEVVWVTGPKMHKWISLSGIAYFPSIVAATPLTLEDDWKPLGGGYRKPCYYRTGSVCMLGGVLQGSGKSDIAVLPPDCRPTSRLIFGVNHDNRNERIDVTPQGRVLWAAGSLSAGWLPLDGIFFVIDPAFALKTQTSVAAAYKQLVLSQPSSALISLLFKFTPFTPPYAKPQFSVLGQLCFLSGLADTLSVQSAMTVLPPACRPVAHGVFNVIINGAVSIRVDVGSDGSVFWAGGSKSAEWVPFDTIHFSTTNSQKRLLALGQGWTSMDGYGKIAYTLEGQFCVLTGVAKSKTPKWDPLIAVLPNECLPADGRIIFSVNAKGYTHRVDVTADGEVVWVAGKIDYGMDWISLNGISFFAGKTAKTLQIAAPFAPFAKGYRIPQYKKQGTLCALSGLVNNPSGASNARIATLPEECRPLTGRLIFGTNKDLYNERIDVLADGSIRYVEGTKKAGWLSLDGISFIVDAAFAAGQALSADQDKKKDASQAQEAEGRKAIVELLGLRPKIANAGKEYLPAQFIRVGPMCLVSGVLKVAQLSEKLLVLPSNCRPDARGAFMTSRGAQHTARTDVLVNGDVQFMGGDNSGGFYPLDQFTFPVARSKLNPIVINQPWYFAHDGQVIANSQGAGWLREGKWCVLTGIVRHPRESQYWQTGATFGILPFECRPSASILVNVNHGFVNHRVDILPNGHMIWVKGSRTSNYLSLYGVNFVVGESAQVISLLNGWQAFGQGYRAPSYTRQGEICIVSGLLTTSKASGTQLIAVLPPDCRPSGTVLFGVAQGDGGEAHVEIDFTGSIKWWGGVIKTGYLSLEGIRFAVRTPKALGMSLVIGQPGGYLSQDNVATMPDAEAFSSGVVASPTNQVYFLNDGKYGDLRGWTAKPPAAGKKAFAGIKFAWLAELQSIAFGRSNQDGGKTDAMSSAYSVQFSPSFLDDRDFDDEWITVADAQSATWPLPTRRHIFNFDRPILAGSIRVVCSTAACSFDEIEAYGKRAIGMIFGGAAGGTFDNNNWAQNKGAVVFASSNSPLKTQHMNNVNDGKYGGDSSWQPAADQTGLLFVGISFPQPVHISAVAMGRDNTGKLTDRVKGQYTVQYSTKPANERTIDKEWTTVGASILLSDLPQPALRHVWNLQSTVLAHAVRLIVSNTNMAIDELELYPHAVNA